MPPPGCEWHIGKTAASTDFVKKAELAIEEMQKQIKWMQKQIDAIKNGDTVLYSYVNIEFPRIHNWEEALVEPSPIELACDSFAMNYVGTDEVWGCGIGSVNDEPVIHVYATDASKVDLPSEYGGFQVVIVEDERPVPL